MKKTAFPAQLTKWDIQCMAYHEAGHAVCSYFLPEREKLVKITINPSDEAFGMIKTKQRQHHNETEISLMSTIATFLAGRAAEEKFLGMKTTSCIYDLSTARDIAKDMAGKFGMGSRMKMLSGFSVSDNAFLLHSESIRQMLDEDIKEIIEKAYAITLKLIEEHSSCISHLAMLLLKNKTLTAIEIEKFFKQEKESGKS